MSVGILFYVSEQLTLLVLNTLMLSTCSKTTIVYYSTHFNTLQINYGENIMAKKTPWKDKWKEIDKVGKGGQGITYLVESNENNNSDKYILKILKDNKDQERRKRMYEEVINLKTLEHTGIPKIVDSNIEEFETETQLYLVYEYIPGRTLDKLITENIQKVSLEQAIQTTRQILDILDYCHTKNIVHRDIKPDNVILRNDLFNDPVLIDFGLSFNQNRSQDFVTNNNQQIGNRFLGLPELRVPNDNKQDKRDFRSDITSCCGIFFYLLTEIMPAELIDGAGNKPHKRDQAKGILEKLGNEQYQIIVEIFDVGFEQSVNKRWQSTEDLNKKLSTITNVNSQQISTSKNEQQKRAKLKPLLLPPSTYLKAFPHDKHIKNISVSDDGKYFLSSNIQGINLWDIEKTKKICLVEKELIDCAVFLPRISNFYAILGTDRIDFSDTGNTLALLDIENNRILHYFDNYHDSWINALTISPNHKLVASGSYDKTIRVWEIETGKQLCCLIGHIAEVTDVAFSSDNLYVASAGGYKDATIRVWDIENIGKDTGTSPSEVRRFTTNSSGIDTIAFSPNTYEIVSGGSEGIALWDIESGQKTHQFSKTPPHHLTHSVSFSPNGKYILAATNGGIYLWNKNTREQISCFDENQIVKEAIFLPDGQYALSHGHDHAVKLWKLPVD